MSVLGLSSGARRAIVVLGLGLCLPLILTACGSATSSTNGEPTDTQPAATQTTEAVATSTPETTSAPTDAASAPSTDAATQAATTATNNPSLNGMQQQVLDGLSSRGFTVTGNSASCISPKSWEGAPGGTTDSFSLRGTLVVDASGDGAAISGSGIEYNSNGSWKDAGPSINGVAAAAGGIVTNADQLASFFSSWVTTKDCS